MLFVMFIFLFFQVINNAEINETEIEDFIKNKK